MTAAPRSRKVCALLAAVFFALGSAASLQAATTERIVKDPGTGLALYGFDPVAYFTDATAKAGLPELEYRFAGVTWRFLNVGNRAAFVANPEVYMPRFGGYDPLGVARGVATPGNPQLWVRRGNRIYLFYREETQAAFSADPQPIVEAAEKRWPAVMNELVQ